MRFLQALLCLALIVTVFSSASADDGPFTGPANWGGTGLMEVPTARVMEADTFRAGIGQVFPYRYYYGAISPLKGLEIDGRVTEIRNVPSPMGESYGNYKDKAIDLKQQILPEGKYLPAIALGIMDPQGNRLYASQYLVASKQIFPFDFTVGLGNGRYGKKPLPSATNGIKVEMFSDPSQWLKDSQFFGGVQFFPSKKLALMAEYSPIRYEKQTRDPAQPKYFQSPVPSKFNFGLRWRPFEWAEIGLSYQRGSEVGFSATTAFNIGTPFIPIYDAPYREGPVEAALPPLERLVQGLHRSGFSDIGVDVEGDTAHIEVQNGRYFYATKAIGTVLSLLPGRLPDGIERVHVTLKESGIPMVDFSTTRSDIIELQEEKLTVRQFLAVSQMRTDVAVTKAANIAYERRFRFGYKPSLETFLNDPSGFFKYRIGIIGWASYHPWNGSSLYAGVDAYPISTISSSNKPLSIPVRSDTVFYKKEGIRMASLLFNQIVKTRSELYGRLAFGYLETEYAGADAEIAMPLFRGRVLLGVSGSAVRKRDPDSTFALMGSSDVNTKARWTITVKDLYKTLFFNVRLNFPKEEIFVDIKAGQFLAGDRGSRITVSKSINGVVLSAWYSYTDTSIFSDPYNKGYHDKGIAVSIPLRLFIGSDSRNSYGYSLSPWTRDVGQDIDHHRSLFDFIGRYTPAHLSKGAPEMFR